MAESFQEQFNRLCELFKQTTQGEWGYDGNGFIALINESDDWGVTTATVDVRVADSKPTGEFIALAHNLLPAIQRKMERLRVDGWCDACAGEGKHASGKECMCNGSGLASDAVRYLRTELFGAETELAAKNEEVERLTKLIVDSRLPHGTCYWGRGYMFSGQQEACAACAAKREIQAMADRAARQLLEGK